MAKGQQKKGAQGITPLPSQGACVAESGQSYRGVYDSLEVSSGVTNVYLDVIILGKIVVRGTNVRGAIYRPLDVNDYADVAQEGGNRVRVVRKAPSDLRQLNL